VYQWAFTHASCRFTLELVRQPFILYRRTSGARGGKVYYAAFWDGETCRYHRRSTGQTSKAAV
jgi:hypothetical protein